MARALAGRLLVVGEPLRRGPRAEADRGLEQRAFDEAALAGALELLKGGENKLLYVGLARRVAATLLGGRC